MQQERITQAARSDKEILQLFDPVVREWWIRTYGNSSTLFTPPQQIAVPLIHDQRNVLICSPTGSGKTLSAFLSILNHLVMLGRAGNLDNSVYCLYISPLKSLANDIHRNLEEPLAGIRAISEELGAPLEEIRHAIRHGDVPAAQKAKMLRLTPHILNTTPETFAILLNSPKFREKMRTIRWVIVDEIHALAGSKRGVHLSVSLERLQELIGKEFVRIGCSATIEPLEDVGGLLAGNGRDIAIADTRFVRKFDLRLVCPVPDLINTPHEDLTTALYSAIDELVWSHQNTLIFTNTRHGAERVLQALRSRFPHRYSDLNSGCHHSSMGKEARLEIEDRLKRGDVRVVTTSTSLELGIDMPYLDLVIQVGSPKSVAALVQRIGRAGHSLDQVVKGRIVVVDRDELIETAVMLRKGLDGFVDRIQIPGNCLDVLAQQVLGMALERPHHIDEIECIVRRSYPYRSLSREALLSVLRYLSAQHAGMDERHLYAKIWYDAENGMVGKKGKAIRAIYYMNAGTIPDEFVCDVVTRDGSWVGKLDEKYLERMNPGDVFVIGGSKFRFRYRRGGNLYVDPTGERPTIPSWYSERLPLSFDLGMQVLAFKEETATRLEQSGRGEVLSHLLSHYPVDENAAASICEIFEQQIRFGGKTSIPSPHSIVVEEVPDAGTSRRTYYVLANYGLRFNEGFSRYVASLVAREITANVAVAAGDMGFILSVPLYKRVSVAALLARAHPDTISAVLMHAVENTNLLKRVFRINAARSFMILRNYRGRKKSARKQQMNADLLISFCAKIRDFSVLTESYREILEDRFEIRNIREILARIHTGGIRVTERRSPTPGPMSFGLAAMGARDVVSVEDRISLIREYHRRVLQQIGAVA